MKNPAFETTLHAKCLISGEHAVLHGAPAVAVPLNCYQFTLQYDPCDQYQLHADFEGYGGENLLLCFWPALEKCLKTLGHSLSEISGQFTLSNTIPIGSGLGFSACMCVAIARWLCFMGWITEQEVFHFAHRCEGLFHGKSSGVDVRAVMMNAPMVYIQGQAEKELALQWQPKLYVSYTQSGSATTKSVATTEHLWRSDADKAAQLCNKMGESSKAVVQSLTDRDLEIPQRISLLQTAMADALACFSSWGLVHGALDSHIQQLQQRGALAVKPTGSGGWGGHVISLWQGDIPSDLELEPLFV